MRAGLLPLLSSCVLLLACGPAMADPAEPASNGRLAPSIQNLGEGRYRIGPITVDKPGRSFSVPGRLLHVDETLEYFAVSRGGTKAYESLLELVSSGAEFQLACILIGLDDAGSQKPRYQFDEREVLGPAVDISISWQMPDESRTVKAATALLEGGEAFNDHDWVYIGSIMQENGDFMAETVGTLIGFVHDPYAVVEHRRGAGIGAYGLITGNADVLPPEGAPVILRVAAITDQGGEDERTDRGE